MFLFMTGLTQDTFIVLHNILQPLGYPALSAIRPITDLLEQQNELSTFVVAFCHDAIFPFTYFD